MIELQPNALHISTLQSHVLDLPIGCCPVSRNPRPGSWIALNYYVYPHTCFIEVDSLKRYLKTYVGGKDQTSIGAVRGMEDMIAAIAKDCAVALGVPVYAGAWLELHNQRMMVFAWGLPCR